MLLKNERLAAFQLLIQLQILEFKARLE